MRGTVVYDATYRCQAEREAEQKAYQMARFVALEVKTSLCVEYEQWQLARCWLQGPSWWPGSDCRVIFC
jgi:hypothetical protein